MIKVRLDEIVEWAKSEGYETELFGNSDVELSGFSSLNQYKEGSLTWINLKTPIDQTLLPKIRCAIIQKGVTKRTTNCIIAEESKKLFFAVLEHFFSDSKKGIVERKNSFVGPQVKLGEKVKIGCNCVLDGDISIGDNTIIEHNVTMINHVSVGSDCIIHSGTVIGKDGFGFSFNKDNIPQKVPHFGGVKIGDRVEIGCNCVIDRGTIDDTTIRDDVKIDNLVLIAHNATIGRGCLIVGETDLAGSSQVGDYSYIGPQVCLENKKIVGNNSFVGMGVMVHDDLDDDYCLIKPESKPIKLKNYRRFL